ncbi:MAG: hypothetical protein IJ094_13135 [Bacilli bacterium]|nr:hypothetical protein [Bacilli bacterium]
MNYVFGEVTKSVLNGRLEKVVFIGIGAILGYGIPKVKNFIGSKVSKTVKKNSKKADEIIESVKKSKEN